MGRTLLSVVGVLALTAASLPLALVVGVSILVTDRLSARGQRSRVAEPVGARPGSDSAISVVMPTWSGRALLEMSLPPLFAAIERHGHPDDEVIVVDNGSDDGTPERLAEYAGGVSFLRILRLPRNEGFAEAANRGAHQARNPCLVLLNNDMVVEEGFVAPLLRAFDDEPNAFGVSCQIHLIDPTKPRLETGKVHGELRVGLLRLFHLDRFDEDLHYPILFAGGGASAYDRAKFLALGGFDGSVFSPVYIEDVDLGYRAWQRGWPSILAPRSRVRHQHRGTTSRIWTAGEIDSFFRKNLVALIWKNVRSWRVLALHLVGLLALPMVITRRSGLRVALLSYVGAWRQLPRTLRARRREVVLPGMLRDEEIFRLSRHRGEFRRRFHPEDPPTTAR